MSKFAIRDVYAECYYDVKDGMHVRDASPVKVYSSPEFAYAFMELLCKNNPNLLLEVIKVEEEAR